MTCILNYKQKYWDHLLQIPVHELIILGKNVTHHFKKGTKDDQLIIL